MYPLGTGPPEKMPQPLGTVGAADAGLATLTSPNETTAAAVAATVVTRRCRRRSSARAGPAGRAAARAVERMLSFLNMGASPDQRERSARHLLFVPQGLRGSHLAENRNGGGRSM